jgi:site-specific DNA-methyltransferase (adenine-specific)
VVNNDDPERFHPNQKPVPLLAYLIRTYTNPGMVVLDNTTGAGSTPVACIETERHFVAFEWNKDNPLQYYPRTLERINRAKNMVKLFPTY